MKEKEIQKQDPNAGVGGLYVVDPKTGVRTLVERTKDVGEDTKPAPVNNDQEG